jgi:hypothetical protein
MKRFVAFLVAASFVLGPVLTMAGEEAAKAAAAKPEKAKAEVKVPAALQDIEVTGKIAKQEQKNKKGEAVVRYILTEADGTKIMLPKPKAEKKEGAAAAAAINLDDFVDKDVKVKGKGVKATNPKGKEMVQLKEITSVEAAAAK